MATLTKEQCLSKINTLNEKFSKIEDRYLKRLGKAERDREKELKKLPYSMYVLGLDCMQEVTCETVNKWYEMDVSLAKSDYDDALRRNEQDLRKAKDQLNKLLSKENARLTYEELSNPIPELVDTLKSMVDSWAEEEIQNYEENPYYSRLNDTQKMEYLVMPIAREITYRSYGVIGKISRFSDIHFIYGKVDMVTYNSEGSKCCLSATIVCGHERTSVNGKTFVVRPHIRTLTK